MEASCGPSNALQSLNKHAQRDNSLQHQFAPRQQERAGFKQGNHVDQRLNQEFNQFNGSNGNEFASKFMNLFNPQQFKQNNFQNQNPQVNNNVQNQSFNNQQGWVNDFSKLSINQPQINNQNHQMNQMGQPINQMSQPMNQNFQTFPLNMRTNLSTPLIPQQPATEHVELHKFDQSLDKQFEMLEQELQEQQQQQQEQELTQNHNSDEFAKIAKTIHNSLNKKFENQDIENKFKNSEFFELMNQVSQGNVEINDEGKDLVYSSTKESYESSHKPIPTENDLPSNTSPLESHNEHMPTYHHPQFDSPLPNSTIKPEPPLQQTNHLPDPLAHIKDGQLSDINDPLMMAKIVSGGQIKNKDWLDADTDWLDSSYTPQNISGPRLKRSILNDHDQQVFDDYRHDDDFH